MTRVSQGKPYAPRVLHSTSGNANYDNTDCFNLPCQTTCSSSNVPINQGDSLGGLGPFIPVVIRDKNNRLHHIWKKVTPDGEPSATQQQILTSTGGYLEACVIVDEHKRKHHGYRRIRGVLTNAELQSPKYVAYRTRARRDVNEKGEQVWSDELEEAFQLAIRLIRPMGKKKHNDRAGGSKSKGRNELISEKIEELTGQKRDRKKVSSHIQVLKNLMGKGSPWLALVTYDEAENADNKPVYRYYDELKNETPSSYLRSQLHDGDVKVEEDTSVQMLVQADSLFGPHDPSRNPSIQRIELGMHIYAAATSEIIHTYTTIQSEMGAQPRSLEDVLDWRSIYPDLAKLYHDHGQLNSEIFLVEANFRLMDDLPPGKSRLGIHLFAEVACNSYMEWNYTTKIYEKGKFQLECSESLKTNSTGKSRGIRLEIPFKSSWWRDVFHNITRQRHKVMATGNAQDVLQDEENARRYLREMTVMQEIYGNCLYDREPQRVAILLWKFRQTRGHETGTTTWRKLHGVTITSPTPVVSQPPLRLESAILSSYDYIHNLPATGLKMSNWKDLNQLELDNFNEPVISSTMNTEDIMRNLCGRNHSMTLCENSEGLTTKASSHSGQGAHEPSFVTEFALNIKPEHGGNMRKEDCSSSSSLAMKYDGTSLEYRTRQTMALSSSLLQGDVSNEPLNFLTSSRSVQRSEVFESPSAAMYDAYDFASQEDPSICINGDRESQNSTTYSCPEFASQDTTGSHTHDFTGGEIHLSFDAEPDLSVYDPALLTPSVKVDSQYQHQSYLLAEGDQEQVHEQGQNPQEYDSGHSSYLSPDQSQEHQPYEPSDRCHSESFLTTYHQPHAENFEQHPHDSQDSQQHSGLHFESPWDTMEILPGHFLGVADAFDQASFSFAGESTLHSWDIIGLPEVLGVDVRQEEQRQQQQGLILGEVSTEENGGMEGLEMHEGLERIDGKGSKEEGTLGVLDVIGT